MCKGKTVKDCLCCPYTDCIFDGVLPSERRAQDMYDRDLEAVSPAVIRRRERRRKYQQSEKGREAQKRYAASRKGKERSQRYMSSDKGREAQRRYRESDKARPVLYKLKRSRHGSSSKNLWSQYPDALHPVIKSQSQQSRLWQSSPTGASLLLTGPPHSGQPPLMRSDSTHPPQWGQYRSPFMAM